MWAGIVGDDGKYANSNILMLLYIFMSILIGVD
jgi:hypothetical protein